MLPHATSSSCCFRAALALLAFPIISMTGVGILWIIDLTYLSAYATVGIISLLIPAIWLITGPKDHKATALFIAVILIALLLGGSLEDFSGDGNTYHIPTLFALLQGWNPIYNPLPATQMYDFNVYVQHYARGLVMAGLPISSLLHLILPASGAFFALQAGKILNFLLPFTTLLLGYAILPIPSTKASTSILPSNVKCALLVKARVRKHPYPCNFRRFITAILFSFNPIVIAQSATYLCDSLLYSELLLMAYALYLLLTPSPSSIPPVQNPPATPVKYPPLFILFAATILAISTKFTHFFYCGIMWAVILAWLLIRRRSIWVPLLTAASATAISLLLIDYSPYITNWLQTGNPLYPLAGCEGFDIMTKHTPDYCIGHSRLYNEFVTLFSTEHRPWILLTDPFPLLFPPVKGLYNNSRMMAYGPLFPLMLLSALILIIRSPRRKTCLIISLMILAAPLLIEQSWWARYCPVLWAIIPLGYLASLPLSPSSSAPSSPSNVECAPLLKARIRKSPSPSSQLTKILRIAILLMTIPTYTVPMVKIYDKIIHFDPSASSRFVDKWYPQFNHIRHYHRLPHPTTK